MNTLLTIQYRPMAAGMEKQNHREIRGMVMFIIRIWLFCSAVWPLVRAMILLLKYWRPAAITGIRMTPM